MIKALLLSGMLLAQTPSLADRPTVVSVSSAQPRDGGEALPQGWWVSPDQMLRIGTKIAECDHREDVTSVEAVLVALGIGLVSGIGLTVWLGSKIK